jgi:hypothetical protein
LPSFGWLRSGRHIRRPVACPDSSCESAEELHMGIDMDRAEGAGGQATAAAGGLEGELGAAERLMGPQGKGRTPGRVKEDPGFDRVPY